MAGLNMFEEFVRSRGRSLREIGSADVALTKEDALEALKLIKQEPVIVLGVNIVNYDEDDWPTYDLFGVLSIGRNCNETLEDLSRRSKAVGKYYIMEMGVSNNERPPGFVLTVCNFEQFNELQTFKDRADRALAEEVDRWKAQPPP